MLIRPTRRAGRCLERQGGFTLVQLMIGLVVSLVILSGVTYVFVGSSQSSLFQIRSTRFIQDMREGMDRMVRDIRRAGYMGVSYDVTLASVTVSNPFSDDAVGGISTLLTLGEKSGEATDSCILYAYNLDDDDPPLVGSTTTLGVEFDADNVELFGFRLSGGALQMRTGMGGAASFTCNSGSWEAITDTNLTTITALNFSLNNQCSNVTEPTRSDCYAVTPSTTTPATGDLIVEVREVLITMTGQNVNDTALTHTLTQRVSIPNDRIYEEP